MTRVALLPHSAFVAMLKLHARIIFLPLPAVSLLPFDFIFVFTILMALGAQIAAAAIAQSGRA